MERWKCILPIHLYTLLPRLFPHLSLSPPPLVRLFLIIFSILINNFCSSVSSSTTTNHMLKFPGKQDLINSTLLPGISAQTLSTINYRHYAGYLDAGDGDQLFYWLFESQSTTAAITATTPTHQPDPLVLWLNGGPGCSSLIGALTEIGPLTVTTSRTVQHNPYTWNSRANLLFIESPSSVGFSFNTKSYYGENDDWTAEHNFRALKNFFHKFPHLLAADLYLAGESYAGIYLPMLATLCIEHRYPPRFRGVAIGNGALDFSYNSDSYFLYAYRYGLFNRTLWQKMIESCCDASLRSKLLQIQPITNDTIGAINATDDHNVFDDYLKTFRQCSLTTDDNDVQARKCYYDALRPVNQLLRRINVYNIEQKCPSKHSFSGNCLYDSMFEHLKWFLNDNRTKVALHLRDDHWTRLKISYNSTRTTKKRQRRRPTLDNTDDDMKSNRKKKKDEQDELRNLGYLGFDDRQLVTRRKYDDTQKISYTNLTLKSFSSSIDDIKWTECVPLETEQLNSTTKLFVERYTEQYDTMAKHFGVIIRANIPMLLYFGDRDLQCNLLGGQWFVNDLCMLQHNKKRKTSTQLVLNGIQYGTRKRYHYNHGSLKQDESAYLDFVTIYHAGHQVPADRPDVAYDMFDRFITETTKLPLSFASSSMVSNNTTDHHHHHRLFYSYNEEICGSMSSATMTTTKKFYCYIYITFVIFIIYYSPFTILTHM